MAETGTNPERADRILDAALRLIVRYGYDKTTVSDIADEAAVSKGAIYLHWKSKDELFEALLVRELRRFSERWLQQVMDDPEGGRLSVMFKVSLSILPEFPLFKAMITQDTRTLGDFFRRQDPTLFARRNMFNQEFVVLMQSVGMVRKDVNPQVMAYMLSCINYGYINLPDALPADQKPPLEDILDGIAELLSTYEPPGGGDSEAGKKIILDLMAGIKPSWDQGKVL